MLILLDLLVNYLIGLAGNLTNQLIADDYQEKLRKELEKETKIQKDIIDRQSLEEQLKLVGTAAARLKTKSVVTKEEQPLFDLLTDELFQEDLSRWLTVWRPAEKQAAEKKLSEQMVMALQRGGVEKTRIDAFQKEYFDRVEKAVSADQILSNWRLNLAMDAAFHQLDDLYVLTRWDGAFTREEVRDQHRETRLLISEIASDMAQRQVKRFTQEQRNLALARYRELALESCDIMDLANLPESDRHIASKKLDLRRLYVPLRVNVEFPIDVEPTEDDLKKLEEQRGLMRQGKTDNDKKGQGASAGERLSESGRLVLLGDPGTGKTTLLRWFVTAYLLKLKKDPAFKELPDVKTLPDKDWLPILVRCRDLDQSSKTGTIDDILSETFRKAHLKEDDSAALQAVMRELLAAGKAILLVDGLDEISDVSQRARFCHQIERLNIAFPQAPIVVTSRIVGYREMNYRIGWGFEHAVVSEFSNEDKDEFAKRWSAVTELPERKDKATEELIHAIHSMDRIERLTGNPMLLTTMALVKRKVGKLPNRRADLYWEAVLVLLNWRAEVDEPIDHREAVPQLQYVAYEMCRQGVQRLREDEILELLEKMREEYSHIRPIKQHDPLLFLKLLESRTGIIIEAGEVRHKSRTVAVFEFRHLTFQEYLAALALVDGRFPGRDKSKALAQHIAPLAGETEETDGIVTGKETVVKGNWREVLRLCVACCGDDDVDEVLSAILKPPANEDPEKTTRPRAVLATSCLADEPNVSDVIAKEVLKEFARQVKGGDGFGRVRTMADSTAMELVGTEWEIKLRMTLVEEFCKRDSKQRSYPGGLAAMMRNTAAPMDDKERRQWFENQVKLLTSDSVFAVIDAALAIMEMAFREKTQLVPGMIEGLTAMLNKDDTSAHAATWALRWLARKNVWSPSQKEVDELIAFVGKQSSDIEAVRYSIKALGSAKNDRATEVISARLEDQNQDVRQAAFEALGNIGDPRAVEPLIQKLEDQEQPVRLAAIQALSKIGDPRAVEPLIQKLEDQDERVRKAAYQALGAIGDPRAVEPLIQKLEDQNETVRRAAFGALGAIGDPQAVEPLLQKLEDQSQGVRQAALAALAKIREDEIDGKLLSQDVDARKPWLDPQKGIDERRVEYAAKRLEMPATEVRRRYETLAGKYGLTLAWSVEQGAGRKRKSGKTLKP